LTDVNNTGIITIASVATLRFYSEFTGTGYSHRRNTQRTLKAIIPNLEPAFAARLLCAACVVDNDAPRVGERAATRGRSAMEERR
jgi:hypothetical protein